MGKYINCEDNANDTMLSRYVINNFPYIEADFDSMTEYQIISKMIEYINKCIDEVNSGSYTIEELKKQFAILQQTVETYDNRISLNTSEIIRLKEDVYAIQTKITALEEKDKQHDNSINKLNSDVTTINSNIGTLNKNVDTIELQQQTQEEEINQITGEVSDIKQDLGNINKEQTLQNSHIEALTTENLKQKTAITSNTKRIKTLEENIFDSGEATGEFINIKDSATAELQKVSAVINKAQETTTGANLIDINKLKYVVSSREVEYIPDGFIFEADGTDRLLKVTKPNVLMDKEKEYYLSANAKKISGKAPGLSVVVVYENGKEDYGVILNAKSPFIPKDNVESLTIYVGDIEVPSKFEVKNLMLSEKPNVDYEPYTGGIASPNPDYPQEIAKVSADWETTSCGKNLWSLKNSYTQVNDGYPLPNTPINIPKGTYRLSINKDTNSRVLIVFKGAGNTTAGAASFSNETSQLLVLSQDAVKTNIYVYPPETKPTTTTISNIQLELGTEPTPYEPYVGITNTNELKGNEFLPGDKYVNKFNEDEVPYYKYLHKNTNKLVIDGINIKASEVRRETHDGKTDVLIVIDKKIDDITYPDYDTKMNIKSNYFTSATEREIATYKNNSINFWYDGIKYAIHIRVGEDSRFTNVETTNEWFKTHNVDVIYEVKEESKQLIKIGAIDIMNMSYNPVTNGFSSIPNIKLTFNYYRDFIHTIANLQLGEKTLKQEIEDNNNEITSLTQRVEALEKSVVPTLEGSETNV